jgi:hypothetical protein
LDEIVDYWTLVCQKNPSESGRFLLTYLFNTPFPFKNSTVTTTAAIKPKKHIQNAQQMVA